MARYDATWLFVSNYLLDCTCEKKTSFGDYERNNYNQVICNNCGKIQQPILDKIQALKEEYKKLQEELNSK